MAMMLTYRYRVKSLQGELNRQARAVNFVWNYCNDAQRHAVKWGRKWLTGFDLSYLTSGSCREIGLGGSTVLAIGTQYAKSRAQHRRPWLRYRGKKSLGWIPFRARQIRRTPEGFLFGGMIYRVFQSRDLPANATIKDGGSFSQDAKGRWYLNIVFESPEAGRREIEKCVGIDLGLKELATLSNGEVITNPRWLRTLSDKFGKAQRARKKGLVRTTHAKIASRRRDYLHKLTTRLTKEFDYIAVGNVNAAGLAKTRMAKSVLDASWSSLRKMLRYKSIANGSTFVEVSEYLTTQTCSACGCLPASRPEGIAGLRIREWTCSDCGTHHDRDVNAAKNILLRSGHRAPVEGIAHCAGMSIPRWNGEA